MAHTASIPVNISTQNCYVASVGTDIYIFASSKTYKYDTLEDTYTLMNTVLPNSNVYRCTSVGTDIYIFTLSTTTYKYDTTTDTYVKVANSPIGTEQGTVVAVGTDIYLFGNRYSSAVYRYDTLTNTYSNALTSVPYGLYSGYFFGGSSVSVGTDIYLIGSFADQNLNCKYDTLKDKYTRLKNIPYGVYMGAVTAIGTDIYIFGTGSGGDNQYLAYKYDTLTETYTKLTNSSYPVGLGAAFAISNNNEINMFVLYSQRVQIMTLITTEFENNSLIIQNGTNYKTELYTNSEIIGKVNNTFTNVLHYTTLNGIEDTISYYGNGTDWLPLRPITSIELDETILYMETGDTLTLNVTIVPNNASDRELIWSSSDTSIATVSSNGLVTKVADGPAVITCSSIDGSGTSATCTVDTFVHTTSVELDKSSANIVESYTTQLNATVYPNNATNKNIIWSSSDTSIATVDDTGLVTAKASGNCVITVTTEEGSMTDSCNITVEADSLSNYYELDYIESTGTQYIDTKYIPLANDKIVIDCNVQAETASRFRALFGARKGSYANNCYTFFTRFNSNNVPCYARTGAETSGSNFIYNSKITLTTEGNTATWTDGTNTYSITSTGTINDCVNPMFLFGNNTSSSNGGSQIDCYVYAKIYSAKIYSNNVLVRDYVPVMSKDGTRIGLFDTVTNTLFTSATNTPLIAGHIKVQYRDITEVEYIQATGTQWLDTGIKAKSSLKTQIKVEPTSNVGKAIYGESFNESADYRLFWSSSNLYFDEGSSRIIATSKSINNIYELELGNYYIKNLVTNTNFATGSTQSFDYSSHTDNIGLFKWASGTVYESGIIYYLKIYDNDTLIRDYIPAKYNGLIGLYDNVNQLLYISNSNIPFIAGPDVEYIQPETPEDPGSGIVED